MTSSRSLQSMQQSLTGDTAAYRIVVSPRRSIPESASHSAIAERAGPDDLVLHIGEAGCADAYAAFQRAFYDAYARRQGSAGDVLVLTFACVRGSGPPEFGGAEAALVGRQPAASATGGSPPELVGASDNARAALRSELDKIPVSSGEPNPNGDDAWAVTPRTVEIAKSVLAALPEYVLASELDPDVSATPQGEVDFDWVTPCNAMLTVGIGPDGEIAFAGTFTDDEQVRGRMPWNGAIPAYVEGCFRRLRDCLSE